MKKAFDAKDLVLKLQEKGLPIVEDAAEVVVDCVFAWVKESVVLTENKLDDLAAPILDVLKPLVDAQVAKIDGK